MPGTLVSVSVQLGQRVSPGDEVRCAWTWRFELGGVVGWGCMAWQRGEGCLLAAATMQAEGIAGSLLPLHATAILPPRALPALPAQVAVVEAMKMRNVLRAAVEGVVKSVEVAAGAVVAPDQPIVRFE